MTSTAANVSNSVINASQLSGGPSLSTPVASSSTASAGHAAARGGKGPVGPATGAASAPPPPQAGPAPALHAKSITVPPVSGKTSFLPAVPAVAGAVNGAVAMNGTPSADDHSRRPSSVMISATGTSGHIPNGGSAAYARPPNISFGSMNVAGSPAIANSAPQATAASLSSPHSNPRVTTPASSPSPIPQPAASGGKPPSALEGQTNGLNFGNVGVESIESRSGTIHLGNMAAAQQPSHLRDESMQPTHGDMNTTHMGSTGRSLQPAGRGRSGYGQGYGQHSGASPSLPMRQLAPHSRASQNMAPSFPNAGQMHTQPKPQYGPNGSPALNPAAIHQHMHSANSQHGPHNSPSAYAGYIQHNTNVFTMTTPFDPSYAYYHNPYQPHPGSSYPISPPSPRVYSQSMHPTQQTYTSGQYSTGQTSHSMSRTHSQASEKPASIHGQASAPVIQPPGHAGHTPSQSSNNPTPPMSFTKPTKAKGIVIKDPDGKVLTFDKKSTPPGPPASSAPMVVSSTPTPPPTRQAATGDTTLKVESKTPKTDAEKKQDFQEQFRKQLEAEKAEERKRLEEDEQKAKEAAELEASAAKKQEEAATLALREEEEAKKAKDEADKALEDAESSRKKEEEEKAEAEREEAERFEREILEMEELERKREAAEQEFQESRKREVDEQAQREAKVATNAEEELKRAERDAEEAEEARQKAKPVEVALSEDKAERDQLFAGLKKPAIGPGAATTSTPASDSRASTPVSDTSMPPPAAPQILQQKSTSSGRPKPAALKLESSKPVEPAQPTAGMQALKSARFLQIKRESVSYPEGILSPNPALNMSGKRNGRQYDKDFLLQFQEVFKEKPSLDWENKVKETVGEPDSVRPASGRNSAPRQNSRPAPPGNYQSTMGSFSQAGRTIPPGTTSQDRFLASTAGARPPTMNNPLASLANRPGGFPVGAAQPMSRTNSMQSMGQSMPHSPRTGAGSRVKTSRRGGLDKAPSRREEEAAAKSMPLTAGQDLKPLEVSRSGWKPPSVGGPGVVATATDLSGHMRPDMVQRKVKAALNKMTPEKFDRISDQVLEIAAQSKDETDGRTLRQVIALTFEKACDEAHWASMYAKFCKRMLETMSPEIKDENVRDKNNNPVVGGALFRKYLLNRCQEEFERGWEVNLPEKPEGQLEEAAMLSEEYYIAAAAKRRGLGLIQFIGELYKLGMLTLRIMHECVMKLLNFKGLPDESAIESLVKLLRTVGATMDSTEAGPKMITAYFERIISIRDMPGIPSRMRFMLLDTVELRNKRWKSKDDQKGPKTIQEIREDVAAQQQADIDKQRQSQRGGGGRPQMGRPDMRHFSGGSMQPPDFPRNQVAADELRKLSKGASGRTVSQGPTMLGPSSMFASSRSGSGRKGHGSSGHMKGADDSAGSSRTGTPPVKEKESASHANQFSPLAALENENASGATSPPAAVSPPTNKAKPSEIQSKAKSTDEADAKKS